MCKGRAGESLCERVEAWSTECVWLRPACIRVERCLCRMA